MRRILLGAFVSLLVMPFLCVGDAAARHTQRKEVVVQQISQADGHALCKGQSKCSGCGPKGCYTVVCKSGASTCSQTINTGIVIVHHGQSGPRVTSAGAYAPLARRTAVGITSSPLQHSLASSSALKRR